MINVLIFTNYSFVLICNLLTCFQKCVFVKVGPHPRKIKYLVIPKGDLLFPNLIFETISLAVLKAILFQFWSYWVSNRAVGRSENPGMPVSFGGHNLPLLVEIGLTDLPKSGGAMAPRHPRGRQA